MSDDGGMRYWAEIGQWEEIETTCIAPPIPWRNFDWQATRVGYEPGDPAGFGATEQEAIADLIEQEKNRG